MGRYKQTIARIGFGLLAIGAFATWFWPDDKSIFLSDPFKIFGFFTALVVWIAAELHTSEEFVARPSTPIDIRIGKELISLYRGPLRDLLKDHNTWSYIEDETYTDVGYLLNRYDRSELLFVKTEVAKLTEIFMKDLRTFYRFVAGNTTPDMIGGRSMTGFKPYGIVNDNEYRRRESLACEADEMSNVAWERLETLAAAIQKKIPEALD